jgi:3-phenylpropionate/trans-cinnamate dioxygenase ferredoxin reductase subunit
MASNGNGLVIVGGGLASARAVKAYREAGGEAPITLLSRDSALPYHRPPLSKRYLRGESEAADALVEPGDFYRENDVDVQLETTVSSLDLGARTLRLTDGGERGFDQLLIASGAAPRTLDVPGADLDGVFTLRTLDDSTRIREAAKDARHGVVVGAGFIGMEVAASLSQLDLEVTLVHRGKGLFEILRARPLAQFLSDLYGRRGVELVLADEVASFGGRSRLDAVETKRGRVAQAELAVVGVGVEPCTDWLEGSGLELDDGVVVNERFETGVEGVWAAGDVARFYDPLYEKHRRIEHWSNANYAGGEVGRLMAGGEGGFDIVSTFFSEVFGVSLKVFGDIDDFDEIVFRGAIEDAAIGFYLRGGRLVACLVLGQDEETESRLKELLKAKATAREAERLADEDVGLDELFSS